MLRTLTEGSSDHKQGEIMNAHEKTCVGMVGEVASRGACLKGAAAQHFGKLTLPTSHEQVTDLHLTVALILSFVRGLKFPQCSSKQILIHAAAYASFLQNGRAEAVQLQNAFIPSREHVTQTHIPHFCALGSPTICCAWNITP